MTALYVISEVTIMNPQKFLNQLVQEIISDWKPFEIFWLFLFVAAQIVAFVLDPQSPLAMISGIAGVICVVFVSKGKISNYLFGLIFAYTFISRRNLSVISCGRAICSKKKAVGKA